MFNALKHRIMDNKGGDKAKRAPYSNIPIFDDVGIIGMPGVSEGSVAEVITGKPSKTDALRNEVSSPVNTTRAESRMSSGKRSRGQSHIDSVDDMIYDKENIPRIPNATNNISLQDALGSDVNAKKPRRAVTIQESKNSFLGDAVGDSRFATDRPQGQRASFTGSRGGGLEESKGDDEVVVEDVTTDSDDEQQHEAVRPKVQQYMNDDELDEHLTMRSFLFSKVRHNHYDVVEACIKGRRHDFTGRFSVDEKGNTLMHVAVQINLKKMCSLLLKSAKCELSAENLKGMTPLDYAELYHFTPLADWLMEKGANNGTAPRK